MTVGGVGGHKRQEIPNTVNIISLFWSIREVFVMATGCIRADGADWNTHHKMLHSAASLRQVFSFILVSPKQRSLFSNRVHWPLGGLEITVVFLY